MNSFNTWIEKLKERRKNENADAILVMSIIFVPFLFLCAGFAMDLTKAVYVKQQYQIMAQEATTAAAKNINITGSINEEAVGQVVSTYISRFDGHEGNATYEGTYGVRNSQCTTVDTPYGTKTAPYMRISLEGGRNHQDVEAITYESEAGESPEQVMGPLYNPNVNYYSIAAEIYDVAPNLMLGMFGRPCQQLKSDVSSITFGNQEDVTDWDDYQTPYPEWVGDWAWGSFIPCTWSGNTVTWSDTRIGSFLDEIWTGSTPTTLTTLTMSISVSKPVTVLNGDKYFVGYVSSGGTNYTVACDRPDGGFPDWIPEDHQNGKFTSCTWENHLDIEQSITWTNPPVPNLEVGYIWHIGNPDLDIPGQWVHYPYPEFLINGFTISGTSYTYVYGTATYNGETYTIGCGRPGAAYPGEEIGNCPDGVQVSDIRLQKYGSSSVYLVGKKAAGAHSQRVSIRHDNGTVISFNLPSPGSIPSLNSDPNYFAGYVVSTYEAFLSNPNRGIINSYDSSGNLIGCTKIPAQGRVIPSCPSSISSHSIGIYLSGQGWTSEDNVTKVRATGTRPGMPQRVAEQNIAAGTNPAYVDLDTMMRDYYLSGHIPRTIRSYEWKFSFYSEGLGWVDCQSTTPDATIRAMCPDNIRMTRTGPALANIQWNSAPAGTNKLFISSPGGTGSGPREFNSAQPWGIHFTNGIYWPALYPAAGTSATAGVACPAIKN